MRNGYVAYVDSTNIHGTNLVLRLKDKTYLILTPNDFKYFLEAFSKEVITINTYRH